MQRCGDQRWQRVPLGQAQLAATASADTCTHLTSSAQVWRGVFGDGHKWRATAQTFSQPRPHPRAQLFAVQGLTLRQGF
jgi:hypothetical protein